EAYIEMGVEPGWLQYCHEHRTKILNGITPYLSESKGEVIEKFIFGTGASGHKREAYYAGWELVNSELKKGVSFKQLAAIKPKDIPSYVKNNLKYTFFHKRNLYSALLEVETITRFAGDIGREFCYF